MQEIPFVKYHAAANDFLVVAAADLAASRRGRVTAKLAALARAILDRRTGVGADGLFVAWHAVNPSQRPVVRIFNADGSEAEMSGNGIRCAAAWLLEGRSKLKQIEIETAAGVKTLELVHVRAGEKVFRVRMGEPILDPKRIPFRGRNAVSPVIGYRLATSIGAREVTVTSMGNPHCSTFVDNFELDWRSLGREIERHPLFPNRTNVEFIRVRSRSRIEVRFWERGVGETASSGTGSSAATVASVLNGFTGPKVAVSTVGGALQVEWARSNLSNQVFLTGPVRMVARGRFSFHQRSSGRGVRP